MKMQTEELINGIEQYLATDFERALFGAALKNLDDEQNPLKFNNFAYSARELSRHVLHRLSPDANVLNCSWYKNETDKKDGITRKQRAYYAVQGGLSDEYVKKVLSIEVDQIHSALIKSISELSKFTHIEEKVFDLPTLKIGEYVNHTLQTLLNFFNLISTFRKRILEQLNDNLDDAVVNEAVENTIQELDELASHYYVAAITIEDLQVVSIDHRCINIMVDGTIFSEMQWGSDYDARNDNGVEFTTSFPFNALVIADIDNPKNVEAKRESFKVDNSSWYEDSFF